jgi:hypothetical protein
MLSTWNLAEKDVEFSEKMACNLSTFLIWQQTPIVGRASTRHTFFANNLWTVSC